MWWIEELIRTVLWSAFGLILFIIIIGSGAPNL